MPFTCTDICKIILAIIFPPIGVFLERGCGADLIINIALTILGLQQQQQQQLCFKSSDSR
ncbi:plasma membrane proteolipid Pmp3 [Dermatophagoides farinae]|uniref:Plasma membrane proteolipid Pmp3 n=1 Tax=Dermatophagoides farinae TaxID=6954 RepID=A0A922I6I9_DERFA|nr:plasma membrane proteolipid Pmp3 [Dermatophagoides farinae]